MASTLYVPLSTILQTVSVLMVTLETLQLVAMKFQKVNHLEQKLDIFHNLNYPQLNTFHLLIPAIHHLADHIANASPQMVTPSVLVA